MTVWYKVDPRRFSLGLLWARSSGVLGFLLRVVVLKVLRINPPPAGGFSLDAEHPSIGFGQMPIAAQQALRPMITECEKHGFSTAYYCRLEILGDAEGHVAHLLHADGRVRGVVIRTRLNKTVESGCAFTSRLQDGAVYSTSNLFRGNDLPPGAYSFFYPGESIDEILSRHQKLLQQLGEESVVTLTSEQLPEESSELRRRTQAYSVARGALTPMTQAEIDRLTVVNAELVVEPGDNPFRTPLADHPEMQPRPRTVWRTMFNGAWYGCVLGLLARWIIQPKVEVLPDATRWEKWLSILTYLGWQPLPAIAGAFFGWLLWRRAKNRTTPKSS